LCCCGGEGGEVEVEVPLGCCCWAAEPEGEDDAEGGERHAGE